MEAWGWLFFGVVLVGVILAFLNHKAADFLVAIGSVGVGVTLVLERFAIDTVAAAAICCLLSLAVTIRSSLDRRKERGHGE